MNTNNNNNTRHGRRRSPSSTVSTPEDKKLYSPNKGTKRFFNKNKNLTPVNNNKNNNEKYNGAPKSSSNVASIFKLRSPKQGRRPVARKKENIHANSSFPGKRSIGIGTNELLDTRSRESSRDEYDVRTQSAPAGSSHVLYEESDEDLSSSSSSGGTHTNDPAFRRGGSNGRGNSHRREPYSPKSNESKESTRSRVVRPRKKRKKIRIMFN
eukprot:UN31730